MPPKLTFTIVKYSHEARPDSVVAARARPRDDQDPAAPAAAAAGTDEFERFYNIYYPI